MNKPILALLFASTAAHADDAFSVAPVPKLQVDLQTFIDGDDVHRTGDELTEIRLDRGEVGATVGLGPRFATELRLEAIRSAAEGGALGIAGDSLVARIKRAQILGNYALGDLRLEGMAGLAADPWIATLELGDPTLPLSRTASERMLLDSPSDLVLRRPRDVRDRAGHGRDRERRGPVLPRAQPRQDHDRRREVLPVPGLRVAAMARDGSIGPASIRDHRFGGMATLHLDLVDAGLEVERALGIAGDATLTGNAFAGWIEARPMPYGVVAARGATLQLDGGQHTTWAARSPRSCSPACGCGSRSIARPPAAPRCRSSPIPARPPRSC